MELIRINEFIDQPLIAVAGVSRNKGKFGNTIYKSLKRKGYKVLPVNPYLDTFDKDRCYKSINELPEETSAIIINTSPDRSISLIEDAVMNGIRHIWLQQGSENGEIMKKYEHLGINLIVKECILMYAKPVGFMHRIHRGINKLAGKYPV